MTSTGLSQREKKDVKDVIKKEGGSYFGDFNSGNIDVVMAKRNAIETAKMKAAMHTRKHCLCVNWIEDSVKAGFALPVENYRINLQAN